MHTVIGSTNKTLQALYAPHLAEMGYRLVRVQLGSNVRPTLQIMAEPLSGVAMTVEGCTEVSRKISRLMDEQDLIGGAYLLEVSSPGLDRPLVEPEDFNRYVGLEARIEVTSPIDGRRKFRGFLAGATEQAARIKFADNGEDREIEIPFDHMAGAKLVLTDDLIKRSRDSRPDSA